MAPSIRPHARRGVARALVRLSITAALLVPLAACTTIRHGGAPEPSFDVDRDLEQLARQFGEASSIGDFYKSPSVDARNQFIAGRLVMTNIRYVQFIRAMTSERQLLDSAADMLSLGLSLAGASVTSAGTKTLLAAVAAGVTGSKQIIDKNYYFEKTIPALVAQMNAERKKALVPILTGMTHDLSAYPFPQAVTDLHGYYHAGTFIGALQAIQAEAGAKEQRQDDVIARLSPVSLVDVQTKQGLTRAIGALRAADLGKARAAVQAIDANVAAADTLEGVKEQLQGIVRGARTPERIAELVKAFKAAGLAVEP